ncbi:MAG TPA: 16S rRNA (guanine(527)-N(7))-methyltransferase RsmG [Dehalococcoidia bacterium]|nr:16S rRNA (guanine(527)-N(7))-methyltransferase RsmG [Dehalococcoidia bacterium]
MREALARDAAGYGVTLGERQLDQFERYAALLREWSERANLVADAGSEMVRTRHFGESIALGAALRERAMLRPASSVIDVGTGAGFPGMVLKIAWPGLRVALLEATGKKTAFLRALADALDLQDVQVLTGRAEDLAHDPSLREQFDLAVARAVGPLPALLELTVPFVRAGGRAALPKGSRARAEVEAAAGAASTLGVKLLTVPFHVPGHSQTLVIAVKQRPTPAAYPRRAGVPRKHPL